MKNKRASYFLFIFLLMERWEGPQRAAERERWKWQKERRSLNPPEYYTSLLSVTEKARCCGEGRGASHADLQHMPSVPWWSQPLDLTGRRVMKRTGYQSDKKVISGGDQSQARHLMSCQLPPPRSLILSSIRQIDWINVCHKMYVTDKRSLHNDAVNHFISVRRT